MFTMSTQYVYKNSATSLHVCKQSPYQISNSSRNGEAQNSENLRSFHYFLSANVEKCTETKHRRLFPYFYLIIPDLPILFYTFSVLETESLNNQRNKSLNLRIVSLFHLSDLTIKMQCHTVIADMSKQ